MDELEHFLRAEAKTIVDRVSFDDFEIESDLWDEYTFKISREKSFEALRSIFMENIGNRTNKVLLVDDICYLKSMRRKLYTLARDHGFATIIVHINVELEVALRRNVCRDVSRRVHEDTIRKIHRCFESPLTSNNIADRYSFELDANRESPSKLVASFESFCDQCRQFYNEFKRDIHIPYDESTKPKDAQAEHHDRLESSLRKVSYSCFHFSYV